MHPPGGDPTLRYKPATMCTGTVVLSVYSSIDTEYRCKKIINVYCYESRLDVVHSITWSLHNIMHA